MSIGNYFIWPKTCCFWTRTGLNGMLNHFHLKECLSEKSAAHQPNKIFHQKFWPKRPFWGKSVTVLAGGQWVNIPNDLKLIVFELHMVSCTSWTIFIWKNMFQKNLRHINLTKFFLKKTEIFFKIPEKWIDWSSMGKYFRYTWKLLYLGF